MSYTYFHVIWHEKYLDNEIKQTNKQTKCYFVACEGIHTSCGMEHLHYVIERKIFRTRYYAHRAYKSTIFSFRLNRKYINPNEILYKNNFLLF